MTACRYFLFDTGAPARALPDGRGGYQTVEVWKAGRSVCAGGLIPELLVRTCATEISEARFNALTEHRGRAGD